MSIFFSQLLTPWLIFQGKQGLKNDKWQMLLKIKGIIKKAGPKNNIYFTGIWFAEKYF